MRRAELDVLRAAEDRIAVREAAKNLHHAPTLDRGAFGCSANRDEELTTRENVNAGLGLSGRHRKTAAVADLHSLALGIDRLAPYHLRRSITHCRFDRLASQPIFHVGQPHRREIRGPKQQFRTYAGDGDLRGSNTGRVGDPKIVETILIETGTKDELVGRTGWKMPSYRRMPRSAEIVP